MKLQNILLAIVIVHCTCNSMLGMGNPICIAGLKKTLDAINNEQRIEKLKKELSVLLDAYLTIHRQIDAMGSQLIPIDSNDWRWRLLCSATEPIITFFKQLSPKEKVALSQIKNSGGVTAFLLALLPGNDLLLEAVCSGLTQSDLYQLWKTVRSAKITKVSFYEVVFAAIKFIKKLSPTNALDVLEYPLNGNLNRPLTLTISVSAFSRSPDLLRSLLEPFTKALLTDPTKKTIARRLRKIITEERDISGLAKGKTPLEYTRENGFIGDLMKEYLEDVVKLCEKVENQPLDGLLGALKKEQKVDTLFSHAEQ